MVKPDEDGPTAAGRDGLLPGQGPPQSLVRSASKSGLPGNLSLRTATFLAFFSGTVVWSVYRASLTSELVVQIPLLPFDSLQGLLESNYQ